MTDKDDLPAGVCTVCRNEPCECVQDFSGDDEPWTGEHDRGGRLPVAEDFKK